MKPNVIKRFIHLTALGALVLTGGAGQNPADRLGQPTPVSLIALGTSPHRERPKAPRAYPILLPLMDSGRLSPHRLLQLLDRDPGDVLTEMKDIAAFNSDCVELSGIDQPDPPDSIDVQHYDIEIHEVDDANQFFRATTTILFTTLRSLDRFDLRMIKLEATSVAVSVDNNPYAPVSYALADSVLHVAAPAALNPGAQVRVRITYQGSDPGCVSTSGIFSGLVFAIGGGGFPTNGIHTFSEPSYGPYWFPSNDNPADKATFRITVTVPQGLVGSASGVLVESVQENGLDKLTWEISRPTSTYLAAFYLGDYVKLEATAPDGTPLEYFTYPNLVNQTLADFESWVQTRHDQIVVYFGHLRWIWKRTRATLYCGSYLGVGHRVFTAFKQ